jgi:hypothetical protein
MALHLLKLCVGCDSIGALRRWQDGRIARGEPLLHRTRNRPKRAAEIVGQGSLYWIIRGRIQVRQRILSLQSDVNGEGVRSCLIGLDRDLIETNPYPSRPMQGWRYLEAADAPPDLDAGVVSDGDTLPAQLIAELKQLGLA